jgi:branched-chain amino acid transport system ATP-binding protein
LKEQGQTILLVEENLGRILGSADHIYLLDNGEIVWNGPPNNLSSEQNVVRTYLAT